MSFENTSRENGLIYTLSGDAFDMTGFHDEKVKPEPEHENYHRPRRRLTPLELGALCVDIDLHGLINEDTQEIELDTSQSEPKIA